jgi:5-(carboxyamino)imidazole ribonucleotide mutase
MMGGLDSLLSMVQMPPCVPCATVGVDAGENAGLLAVQILALGDNALANKLESYKKQLADKVAADNEEISKIAANVL